MKIAPETPENHENHTLTVPERNRATPRPLPSRNKSNSPAPSRGLDVAWPIPHLLIRVCPENWVPKSGHITTIFLGRGVLGMMPVRNVVKNERVGKLEMRR